MIPSRTRTAAVAATGALLLTQAAPTTARSQPALGVAQPGAPDRVAIPPSPLARIGREARPAAVEREHVRAQRVIARICTGC